MKALILAAGKGNRLKPYTDDTPKPLLTFGTTEDSKTILEHILKNLPSYIDEVIIITKYLAEHIEEFILNKKDSIIKSSPHIRSIECLRQTEAKGTLGAVLSAKHLFDGFEQFLVLNGDDIHDQNDLTQFNATKRTFGAQHKIMPGYKSIQINPEGTVTGLTSQTEQEKSLGCLIATGVYLIDTDIFNFDPVILSDGEIGLPQTLLAHLDTYPMHVYVETGWIPVNTIEDFEYLRSLYQS